MGLSMDQIRRLAEDIVGKSRSTDSRSDDDSDRLDDRVHDTSDVVEYIPPTPTYDVPIYTPPPPPPAFRMTLPGSEAPLTAPSAPVVSPGDVGKSLDDLLGPSNRTSPEANTPTATLNKIFGATGDTPTAANGVSRSGADTPAPIPSIATGAKGSGESIFKDVPAPNNEPQPARGLFGLARTKDGDPALEEAGSESAATSSWLGSLAESALGKINDIREGTARLHQNIATATRNLAANVTGEDVAIGLLKKGLPINSVTTVTGFIGKLQGLLSTPDPDQDEIEREINKYPPMRLIVPRTGAGDNVGLAEGVLNLVNDSLVVKDKR